MLRGTGMSLAFGLGAALLLGGNVYGQEAAAKAQNDRAGQNLPARDVLDQRPRAIQRTAEPRVIEGRVEVEADAPSFYRATDVIGMTIMAEGNARVGVVKDIVLDAETNEIAYFLVDSTTVLKTEGLLVVPYVAVRGPLFVEGRPAKTIVLSYGVDRLRQAPTITAARWSTIRSGGDFFIGVNRFFGVERGRRGLRPGDIDRDGRDRDGRDRDGRDRDGDARDRDGRDRPGDRDRDGDTDRPRRPGDRDDTPRTQPREERDGDTPRTQPRDPKRPVPPADGNKPTVKPEIPTKPETPVKPETPTKPETPAKPTLPEKPQPEKAGGNNPK